MERITNVARAPQDFYYWMQSVSDPRIKNWPLCDSPFPLLFIMFVYVCFVKIIGPRWMAERKPFRLEALMMAYNAFMIAVYVYFFLRLGNSTYFRKYNWICEPIDNSNSPSAATVRNLSWWFFICRIFEMTDTVFFVLRKSTRQISNLHVIHHCLVPVMVWIPMKFNGAGGSNVFFMFFNCFVHIIMYTYYLLASLGPSMKKYIWWKRQLTVLQMGQFAVVFVHGMMPLVYDCGFDLRFCYIIAGEALLFMVLFTNFYLQTYKRGKCKASSGRAELNDRASELTETLESNSQTFRRIGMKQD